VIEGHVEGSVLFPGVRVKTGAAVQNSIIFHDCEIGSGATVTRAVLDKNVVVGEKANLGCGASDMVNRQDRNEINDGLTLVGKNTRLPPALCVARGCAIGSDLIEEDLTTNLTDKGQWLGPEFSGFTLRTKSRSWFGRSSSEPISVAAALPCLPTQPPHSLEGKG
jgi:glucose-1-phosphate adenylyltransferase